MNDTIAAIATPTGHGGVGIVRVSGAAVKEIAQTVLRRLPEPRKASYVSFFDQHNALIDRGIALFFPAPHSFTGQDILELQGHGGPIVMDMLLTAVLKAGARRARPGEFSERAFLNDKLDLAQAEAVADLIDATSVHAARAAQRTLQGVFSSTVNDILDELTAVRTYVEAALDFPDEEIDFLADPVIKARISTIKHLLADAISNARTGSLLRDGIHVAILGAPNVGKSSLLNRLARRDVAIVTDIPGTTRDVLRERITLRDVPLHIHDTAGLHKSADPVEQEGIRRAKRVSEESDLVLWLLDDREPFKSQDAPVTGQSLLAVSNKCDLSKRTAGLAKDIDSDIPVVRISALTGAGIEELESVMLGQAGYRTQGDGDYSARRRHVDALDRTQQYLAASLHALQSKAGAELAAEDLRLAQQALGEITGAYHADDLLGKIFSSFCIGK